jgi:acyl-CoA thioester hydrolase
MRRDRDFSSCARFIEIVSTVAVRFQEVDALGIVWHGHYLSWFEEGRVAFGRAYGFDYLDIYRASYFAPIIRLTVDWKAPARYGDVVEVRTRFHEAEGAKILYSYRIANAAGRVLATATSVQLFSDLNGDLVLAQPQFYADFLDRCRPSMRRE